MRNFVSLGLLVALGCGRVTEDEAVGQPQPDPVPAAATPAASPARPVTAAPRPDRSKLELKPAGYRTTTVAVSGGPTLDDGTATLMIDTTRTPPRVSLRIHAESAYGSLEANLRLDVSEFVDDETKDLKAILGGAGLVLQTPRGPQEIQVAKFQVERIAGVNRRTQLRLRGLSASDEELVTIQTQYAVECFVRPADIGAKPEAVAGPGSAPIEVLATDTTLESPVCRKFLALL